MAKKTPPKSRQGYEFEPFSDAVFGACIAVQRQMGVHCMEVDYQRALEVELKKRGLEYEREVEVPVPYDGQVVTSRRVSFLIWDGEDEVLLETSSQCSAPGGYGAVPALSVPGRVSRMPAGQLW